jgi:hypothetical protein
MRSPCGPKTRPPFWVAVQEIIRSVADRVTGLPDCLGPGLDASASQRDGRYRAVTGSGFSGSVSSGVGFAPEALGWSATCAAYQRL